MSVIGLNPDGSPIYQTNNSVTGLNPDGSPIYASTPPKLDINGQPIAAGAPIISAAPSLTSSTPIGNTTLDDPRVRYDAATADNNTDAVNFLNKTHNAEGYHFALTPSNDIAYSHDNGKSWNRFEKTLPTLNSLENDPMQAIASSLAQKVPDITEMTGMGVGGAIGAAAGLPELGLGSIPGSALGAATGGATANALNQAIANFIGTSPIGNKGITGAAEEAAKHGAIDAAADVGGKLILGPLAAGAKELVTGAPSAIASNISQTYAPEAANYLPNAGNAVKNAFQDAISGRAISPSENLGKILPQPIADVVGSAAQSDYMPGNSIYQNALKGQNQNYASKVLNNLDKNLMKTPGVPFEGEPGVGASLGDISQGLKQALIEDKADADDYWNAHYGEIANGGTGFGLPSGSPGLNTLPVDKSAIINDLKLVSPKTPDGKNALSEIIDTIQNHPSTDLGDFLDIKRSIQNDFKPPMNAFGQVDKSVGREYKLLKSALENSYQDQITDPNLSDAYSNLNSQYSNYSRTMGKIQDALVKNKDASGLKTIQMMKSIKPLLDNLNSSDGAFMPRSLDTYKRGLAAELVQTAKPPVPGIMNWGAFNKFANDPMKMDYLQRILTTGDDTGANEALSKQLEEIKQIGKNPSLFPNQAPKETSALDVAGPEVGAVLKLAKTGVMAAPRLAGAALTTPAYNPFGTAGYTLEKLAAELASKAPSQVAKQSTSKKDK